MKRKTALITGITGQDGSYLAEFLLSQEYRVVGMVRRTSTVNFDRLRHIQDSIDIVQGDLLDRFPVLTAPGPCVVADLYDPYHLEVLEACLSREPAKAVSLLARHIEVSREHTLGLRPVR